MRFKFTLASLLRVRESMEQREELLLMEVQFEIAAVQRRIDELTAEIAKASDGREKALQTWMQACELQSLQNEMSAAVQAKKAMSETLAALKKQRDAQMKLYQAARMNRRVLTDLEGRQRGAWERDQLRTDQKRLDDIFGARIQRN